MGEDNKAGYGSAVGRLMAAGMPRGQAEQVDTELAGLRAQFATSPVMTCVRDNVVELRRCRRCGKPARERDLLFQGEPLATFDACDACIAETDATLSRVRPVFDAMLAAGIDRGIANDVMTVLLERITPPPSAPVGT